MSSQGSTRRLPPRLPPEEEADSETEWDWRSLAIAGGVALWLAFMAVSAWRYWRRARMTPIDYVGRFWERLIRYGVRLDILQRASQTPVEYAQLFNAQLRARTLDTSHWEQRMQQESA